MGASSHNLSTPWRFRDDTEYLVSVSVSIGGEDKSRSISLVLSDKITAEEWSGEFDVKYIENLTQRTGNYKPFDTFVAMIKSAILKKSDAVALDLMSYEDLLTLRSQRKRPGQAEGANAHDFLHGPNLAKFDNHSVNSDVNSNRQAQSQLSGHKPKKYFIITYVAEFDKVHYPLPLKYTGYPDTTVMQQTIQRLKSEVDHLKHMNAELVTQLKSILKSKEAKLPPSTEIRSNPRGRDQGEGSNLDPNCNYTKSEEEKRDREGFSLSRSKCNNGSSMESIQSLANLVARLEVLIEDERMSHEGKMYKLEKENGYLRKKLKSMENSESILKDKVNRLESVLAMNVGLKKNPSTVKQVYRNQIQNQKQSMKPSSTYSFRSLSNPMSRNDFRSRHPSRTGQVKKNTRLLSSSRDNSSCRSSGSSIPSGCIYNKRSESENNYFNGRHNVYTGSNPTNPRGRGSVVSASSRSHSRDGKPTFNPTEYVKQKQMKQEKMAKLRMAKVEGRIKKNASYSKYQDGDVNVDHKDRGRPSNRIGTAEITKSKERGGSRSRSSSVGSTEFPIKSVLLPNAGRGRCRGGKVQRRLGAQGQSVIRGTASRSPFCYDHGHDHSHIRRISPSPTRPATAATTNTSGVIGRQSRKTTRDADTSFDGLQRRLRSIHKFLGKKSKV